MTFGRPAHWVRPFARPSPPQTKGSTVTLRRQAGPTAALMMVATGWLLAGCNPVVQGTQPPPSPSLSSATGEVPSGGPARDAGDTFAVIGDVPYGREQVAAFPSWIEQINDGSPELAFHLGDIKDGSSRCDDAYYRLVRADFDRFAGALIYTPGDNEWADCHPSANGRYQPLERLAFARSVFFDRPGTSLGQRMVTVSSEVSAGFPENVQLRRRGIDFAALHVVGSNDGLQPWTGLGLSSATPEQVAEERARMANVIEVVRATFATARAREDRAVVLMQQANMFASPAQDDISAFKPLVQTIVAEASTFPGQVYLFNGDSHTYETDRPLAAGSSWLATYGITGSAGNLTRVTVDGSSNNKDWLKVTVNPPGAQDVLSWQRVPYTRRPTDRVQRRTLG